MADNRMAYGLAKKYGIDTAGMSPKEVWEALKEKGVTENIAVKEYRENERKSKGRLEERYGGEKDGLPLEGRDRDEAMSEAGGKSSNTPARGIMKYVAKFQGKPEGTYNYKTGKPVNLTDGYMVTFHQNEADEEGHYKTHYGRYTEEEYDRLANEFVEQNDAEMYVGVFDNEPEISFKVKTKEQALRLMFEHNQDSIWDNETAAKGDYENALIKNTKRDKSKNPLRGEQI